MLTITVDDTAVQQAFARLLRAGQDMTAPLRAVGQEMETRVAQRFEAGHDPDGIAWAPLRPATLKRKNGRGSTLVFTGQMLDSLNHQVGQDWVEIGFGQPYAAFHEWGTRHMPRRGMLLSNPTSGTLGEEDHLAILETLGLFMAAAWDGNDQV